MGRDMRIADIIVLAAIAVIIFLVFQERSSKQLERIVTRIDTIEIVKPVERVVIAKAKPKVVVKRDTIVCVKPFIAELDTIVRSDTIQARYNFPENTLDIKLSRMADTIRIPRMVISNAEQKETWWHRAIPFAAGAIFGYALSRIK